ncbi:portal protein [Paenibacillus chitinolyticus]|uniref:portal protein n=1 Tax=Paenibacillus chitinolyticus TaxID=79263 RepID=UPI00364FCCCD
MAKTPDKKALDKLLTRIEAAENWRDRNYKDRWTKYYKMYRNHVDPIMDPESRKPVNDRSNISIPYPETMLETTLPRLLETMFASRPYIKCIGVPLDFSNYEMYKDLKPWEESAKKMELLLDYQHNVVFDLRDKFHTGLKIAGLYGTTVAFTGWRYKERGVIRKELQQVMEPANGIEEPMFEADGVTPVMDWQPVETTIKEYDDPEVEFLDLGLFFVDPNAVDVEDARFAGHVQHLPKSKIDEMVKFDENLKVNWKKVPKEAKKNEARSNRQSAIGIPMPDDNTVFQHEDEDLIEVIHYFEDDRYAIILNRGFLARDTDNPFWHKKKPYDKDVFQMVPHEFYGRGVMEMLEDLHLELNTERNQRIDYRSFSMRRMFWARRGACIPRSQLKWRQGGIIESDEPDDIKVMEAPEGNVASSFNQEQIIKKDMQDVTGAHDVVMGTSGRGETATSTMSKDNNASLRFKMLISSLEKRLLVSISRKMIQLNQQFIEDVRMLIDRDQSADQWPQITPEEIQGEFHLTAAGSSVEPMANKEAFKQRMVELYGMVAADTFMQQFPVKRRNMLKKVFEAFDIHDTEDLLPTDEELSGVIEQQVLGQFLSQLPPELLQLLNPFLPQPGGGLPEQQALGPPAQIGGGANTAMSQEQGMQMTGAGA